MKWLKYILTVLSIVCCIAAYPAVPTWEHINTYRQVDVSEDNERIEVTVHDGYIYVTTSKVVTVRLTSILGQLISQQSLQAGTSRIKINARGIYILKAGSFTTRVTV